MPRGQIPVGTVTFLFTDIEGSTKLWEAHPETMRIALARHDALMRAAIGSSNGYVFKTVGDAFCAAFATATEAVEAVVTAQLALAAEPWPEETPIRVRMALHTGAVESRDDDYFGPPVNRVARLLSTTHGGQSVLSQTTYDLVRDFLPPQSTLKDLGSHMLKDLARPEQLFQLHHPLLSAEFPPLRSLSTHPNNLPQQLTSFIGREKETEDLESLLRKNRLVTLTGSGGTGKSRLSLQVAADALEQFPDGAWLVELAPLTDPNLVASTVANVLGLKEVPGMPILQTLTEYLKTKRLLLIQDNCEHLLGACAKLADSLLRQCPQVLILATSREGFGISGEQTYRVPSLSLPDPKQVQTPETLGRFEAARLFVDRAILAQSSFRVTNENAPALASICHRLDGIPLAIELAAARVRSLSVEEINHKLDQRFKLLTGGSRTALPRQQTLRSLIDWSYDLLNDAEKALLSRLSVFLGGWTLEAAEAVCSGDPVEDWETLDLLTSLGDKSLVVAEQQGGATRYRLLETVRQYARDRLLESGYGGTWKDRHLAHFLVLGEEAEPELKGTNQLAWLERLETEHDNLRAALEWSAQVPEQGEGGLRICAAIWRLWWVRGYCAEGRKRCATALSNGQGTAGPARAGALTAAGILAYQQGDYADARRLHEESLDIRQDLEDREGIALSLNNLGMVAQDLGDYAAAAALHKKSLEIRRDLGDRWGVAMSLGHLGIVAHAQGEYSAARALNEESLAIRRGMGNRRGIALSLANLGIVAYDQGDYGAARALHQESLAIFRELGDRWGIAMSLEGLAPGIAELGNPCQAAVLFGTAERLLEEIGTPLPPRAWERHESLAATARATLNNDAEFEAAWAEGRGLALEEAIELALNISGN